MSPESRQVYLYIDQLRRIRTSKNMMFYLVAEFVHQMNFLELIRWEESKTDLQQFLGIAEGEVAHDHLGVVYMCPFTKGLILKVGRVRSFKSKSISVHGLRWAMYEKISGQKIGTFFLVQEHIGLGIR